MREIIRFAWGSSSLGDFIVAMSDKGIVTLEFSSMHTAMEDALRIRFPEAGLEGSQEELADVVGTVARALSIVSCSVTFLGFAVREGQDGRQ